MSTIDIFELLDRLKRIPLLYVAPENQEIFKEENLLTKHYRNVLLASSGQWIQGQEGGNISSAINDVITINNVLAVTSWSHNSAMKTLAAIRDAREDGFILYLRDFSLGANRYYRWRNDDKTPAEAHISISPEYGDHSIVNALKKHISKPVIGLYNDSYLKPADHIKINNRGGSALASLEAIGQAMERMLPLQLSVHNYQYNNMIRTQPDTWKGTVTALAEMADAVVLYVSELSEGTRWETALINILEKQKNTLVLYGKELLKGKDCPSEIQIKDEFVDYFAVHSLVDSSTYASLDLNIELSLSEDLANDLIRLSNISSIKGRGDSIKIGAILLHPFYFATRPVIFEEDESPLVRQLLVSKDMRPLYEQYMRLRGVTLPMVEDATRDDPIDRVTMLQTSLFVFAMASMFEDHAQVVSSAVDIQELAKAYISEALAERLDKSIMSLAESLTATKNNEDR